MNKFLAVCLAATVVFSFAARGDSAEPAQRTRTFALGDAQFVALLDTVGKGKAELLIGAGDADLERAGKPGGLDTTINCFLLKKGGKTILFDTGLPPKPGVGVGPALKQAGVDPKDVDAVVITHFHFDHVGGLLDDGKPVFPNAELFVPRVEADKWTSSSTAFLTLYRTNAFEWGDEVLPGIKAIRADGHTPGHTVFDIGSGKDRMLIIGDLIHLPAVQLANPRVAVTYDTDPKKAVETRLKIFAWAAAESMPIASMHIPFPGVGVLARDGEGYTFAPSK